MNTILIGIFVGVASGIIAALCGVGGGIIMVPAFVMLLGLSQKNAVATSLAAMILIATAATVKNGMNHFVEWRLVLPTTLTAALISWFAADALKQLSSQTLSRIFAAVLIGVGVRMLFQK